MQKRALLLALFTIASCSDGVVVGEPDSFEIGLHGWACLEHCKQFALSIDASGRVHVHYPAGEPRLATFDIQAPAESARELYRAISNSNFTELLDRYSADAGSCEPSALDRTVSVLSLRAASDYKQVVYKRGCPGDRPDLDKLRDLERQVRELATIDQLLSITADPDCTIDNKPLSFAPAYTIREPDATGVGVLRFTNTATQRRFIVQGCSGAELGQGTISISSECSAQLQFDEAQRWPGTNQASKTIFIQGSGGDAKSEVVAFLSISQTAEAEVATQVALQGSTCEGGSDAD